MSPLDYLTETDVEKCLNWSSLIPKMESALVQLSERSVVQPERIMMRIPEKNGVFLAMPGYSSKDNKIGCKLVTSFPDNKNKDIPSIIATIMLFDADTGRPEVILESTQITGWRTAAASAAATIHLHTNKKILAIFGTGVQAKAHALAFQHQFNFDEVRIWGRNYENAKKLCDELGSKFIPVKNGQDCAQNADVIVTATYAPTPIVKYSWLKPGVLINAVGAGNFHYSELDMEIYTNSVLVVDQIEAAQKELKGLLDVGIKIWGEVGEIILKKKTLNRANITIFHSLGMAIEDVLTAKLVYETYKENNFKKP